MHVPISPASTATSSAWSACHDTGGHASSSHTTAPSSGRGSVYDMMGHEGLEAQRQMMSSLSVASSLSARRLSQNMPVHMRDPRRTPGTPHEMHAPSSSHDMHAPLPPHDMHAPVSYDSHAPVPCDAHLRVQRRQGDRS
jgi:hypothetical protein